MAIGMGFICLGSSHAQTQSEYIRKSDLHFPIAGTIPVVSWVSDIPSDSDTNRAIRYNGTSSLFQPGDATKQIELVPWTASGANNSEKTGVLGLVMGAASHLSADRKSVYVILDVHPMEIYHGKQSREDHAALMSMDMVGGAVHFASGALEIVKPPDIGFPQVGHVYLFVGHESDGESFSISRIYVSQAGKVWQFRGASRQAGAFTLSESGDFLKEVIPEAIPDLLATEDTRVPILSLGKMSPEQPMLDARKLRYSDSTIKANIDKSATPPFLIGSETGHAPALAAAELVVEARVTSSTVHVATDWSTVYSTSVLSVSKVIQNRIGIDISQGTISVETYGGRVITPKGYARISGSTNLVPLNPGSRYLLFLKKTENQTGLEVLYSFIIIDDRVYGADRRSSVTKQFDGVPLGEFEKLIPTLMSPSTTERGNHGK